MLFGQKSLNPESFVQCLPKHMFFMKLRTSWRQMLPLPRKKCKIEKKEKKFFETTFALVVVRVGVALVLVLVLWLLSWDCFCSWCSTCGWFVSLFGNKNCGYFCKTSCWLGEINLRWDIVEEQTGESMMLFNSLGLNCGEFQEVM